MTLKPCPFCGCSGGEQLHAGRVGYVNGEGVRVFCAGCGAEGPIEYAGLLGSSVKPKHWTAAEKRWNTRAAQPTSMKGR